MHFGWPVIYFKEVKGPPMGNGYYPDEGEGEVAAFYRVIAVDKNGQMYDFEDNLMAIQNSKECYCVSEFKNKFFFYGGSTCYTG